MRRTFSVVTAVAFSCLAASRADDVPGLRLRRPIALALIEDGKRLVVANRDSGTVVLVDPERVAILHELRVGHRLSDLAATRDGKRMAVIDEAAGELILLEAHADKLRETTRHKTPMSPVGVRLLQGGRRASVACLWPRQIQLRELGAAHSAVTTIDLPFAPRRQLALPGEAHSLVADAFGGQVAVVDAAAGRLESVRSMEGHNLRGVALSHDRKRVVLVHQVLHAQGRPNATDIRSGALLANHLRTFDLDTVRDPRVDLLKNERIYNLGDIERGAGDPADVHETADGLFLICLAGTNELAVGRPEQVLWDRVPVGARPGAIAVDEGRGRAYVANTFDDSVSIVDFRARKPLATIPLRRDSVPLTQQERGEVLFHDARLSLDAWFSCQSCHPDGHTNGRLNDNFSDRSFGTPKRVLSLRGVRDTAPWAWNGRIPELEAQVRSSVTSTMQGSAPSAEQVADLAAYLRSLEPAVGVATARGDIDADAFKRGRKIFSREKCASCHAPPTYTTPKTYDVGLRDEAGESHFNPPSLRGVSQGGPRYFHDNRTRSLADVFRTHRHQLAASLSESELADLLVYLRSL
jgi:cytochrome c peroxidase